jgi:hypothetical protein
MKRISSPKFSTLALALLVALRAGTAHADTVVQIPLPGVIDTRSVFTLTNGAIVPFTLAIDGGNGDIGTGAQNGFATKAVAMMKSPGNVANSLPDDGHFPADANHPEVVLNFSNAAEATSPQNHLVKPTGGTFTFPVPNATYSKLFVFFHGANGGSKVTLTLTYADATTDVTTAMIPDFFSDPSDPKVFVLAGGLAKWTKTTTIAEANHHNLFGITVTPMAKTLTTVKVERGATGFLVFWGATGIATSAVAGLDGGTTDAGGAAGAGAAGGATGAAGVSGMAGATGAAGSSGGAGAAGGASGQAGATGSAGATGTAGTTGAAGTMGAAGTTGSAGATGAGGTKGTTSGGSGCSCRLDPAAESHGRGPSWLGLGVAIAWAVGRQRRRSTHRR